MEKKEFRKRVVHHRGIGVARALTFSCYHRMPILERDDFRVLLSRSIDDAVTGREFDLVGFVYMPEHVHLLVMPRGKVADVSGMLAALKRTHSFRVKLKLQEERGPLLEKLMIRERPEKKTFRYWQEGSGYDKDLETAEEIRTFLDYMHGNPIKRGLVDRADQWKWSSWHHYFADNVPEGLPKVHGMPGMNLI